MANIPGRSFKVPTGFGSVDPSRLMYDKVYIGFVKDYTDYMKMGRLSVWIPELSGDPQDDSKWFTVRYMSPFAGATEIDGGSKGGKTADKTQQSYGWWGIVPDLNNEVVITFANGDSGRGIVLGCLYQEYMNHMVPGIATGPSFQSTATDPNPPVMEYNKWGDTSDTQSPDPTRPRFEPLHTGLYAQGLYGDAARGPSTASARNVKSDYSPAPVYGFLSPNGNQWYVSEETGNEYIRIRSQHGAQILVHDTLGMIYINSKNGDSWVEISDEGIDLYTRNSFSIRAQRDINLKSDMDINFEAGGTVNFRSMSGPMRLHAKGGNLELKSDKNINIDAGGQLNLLASSDLMATAGSTLSASAGGVMFLSGANIQQNSGSGGSAANAITPVENSLPDTILTPPNYPATTYNTIVSRMPSHEPWALHNNVTTGGTQMEDDAPEDDNGVSGVGRAGTADKVSAPETKVGKASAFKGDPTELGSVSAKYESNGNPGAIGWDSTGGYSYGAYQIAANTGTLTAFLNYLQKEDNDAWKQLDAAGGSSAGKAGNAEFKSAWKDLAANNPKFPSDQHNFIKATHYDPACNRIDGIGLDVNNRSKALQDVVWSCAVQHGAGGAAKIFSNALSGKSPATMSDTDIINAVYDERSKVTVYFKSSTASVQQSVLSRYKHERQDALAEVPTS